MKRFLPLLAGEGAVAAPPAGATPSPGSTEGAQPGAAAAPAPPPKPAEPKVNATELATFARDFLGKQMGGQPDKPDEQKPKPGEPGAAAAPAAPAAPAKPKAAKKATKVQPRVEPPVPPVPALTPEQIAEAAAKGVAQVMKPGLSSAPKTELTDVEQRRFNTLQHMERMYPEKYVGVADRYKTSMLELQKYADDWEKAHPDQQFDETAEEHEGFFAKHDVDWEDEDYTEALADIRASARLEEDRKKSDQRMSKLERTERLRQASPEIGAHQTAGATVFWRNTTKELADVIKPDGTVDVAKLEEAKKKDPIGYTFRVNAANQLNHEIAELYKVMNGLADFDPKQPVHVAMGHFATLMERDIVRRPDEEKRDADGRMFLPATEYWKVPKERRENYYWTFSPAELAALRAHSLSTETEKEIVAEHQRQREYALAMGWKPPEGDASGAPGETEPHGATPGSAALKPESPGGAAETRLHAAATGGAGAGQDFLSAFSKKQLGQS